MLPIEDRLDFFKALVREHEGTIRRICASFYPVGSYDYLGLACDLTTYLWRVCLDLPPDAVIRDEHAWVFKVLHHYALGMVRNESRRQQRLVYGADLTGVVDEVESDPLVDRLYRSINNLDDDDREIVLMYVDNVPIKQIALVKDMSYHRAYRRIAGILNKIRQINSTLDDDDDDTFT